MRASERWSSISLALLVLLAPSRRSAASSCPGDLNDDCDVTVGEVMIAIDSALNQCPSACTPFQSTLLVTGQKQCDAGDGMLGDCPGVPARQDGEVKAGQALGYSDKGDGTIADTVTGLVWEKLSHENGVHDVNTTYTWRGAFDGKIAALNSAPCFAGHCDWRLPNRRELDSLVDVDLNRSPVIDVAFDDHCSAGCTVTTCSCTQLDNYWTSTSDPTFPDAALTVDFNTGYIRGFGKSVTFYVRAVRGGV